MSLLPSASVFYCDLHQFFFHILTSSSLMYDKGKGGMFYMSFTCSSINSFTLNTAPVIKLFFNGMLLSCHVRGLEWMYTLYLPECQRTPCSKQAWYLKLKWQQRASLAKVFVYELSGCGFESCCCHLIFFNDAVRSTHL